MLVALADAARYLWQWRTKFALLVALADAARYLWQWRTKFALLVALADAFWYRWQWRKTFALLVEHRCRIPNMIGHNCLSCEQKVGCALRVCVYVFVCLRAVAGMANEKIFFVCLFNLSKKKFCIFFASYFFYVIFVFKIF
jgi:hypothetical protein